ncbi:winged helix-turn-helix transcriptional regulator [Pectinatus cerevisiiphilus]|uniref:HxlR family transcriptional regulator n=1 Tax=Pectinatus cerevisiiphilus TaxID=86956 RepID=A0A4V2US40_9FIRM|nr:helix-turn-helix domain-containing protein [Pectinatus cerevisiiphilus]TCS79982.1 HxlR family transcriptional regulator [Pectinatus cerevisiiphilus]
MDALCRSTQAPFEYALSIVDGKWKLKIIYELACTNTLRYGELKKNISQVTHKMLTSQLKELEKDGMINRKEFCQIPPKVEYSLTKRGMSFIPILEALCDWGKVQQNIRKPE